MSLFSRVVDNHGLNRANALTLKSKAVNYTEFDNGFCMLIPEAHGTFRFITAAIDNDYNISMWRHIHKTLKRRTGPTYMQFTENYEILFKAAKHYGGIELFEGIVLFP